MGLFDAVSKIFNTDSFLPSLILGGAQVASSYSQPDPPMAYGNTEAGFNAQMDLERQKMAQALEIAKLSQGGAGAGAAATRYAAKLQYDAAMKQLKEKALADKIAAMLNQQSTEGQLKQGAAGMASSAYQNQGEQGRIGFQNAAQLLQGYRS